MTLNDILFSEEFLFEGEQADAYRAKKAAEYDKQFDDRRYPDRRERKLSHKVLDTYDKAHEKLGGELTRRSDAIVKAIEKHGVMSKETDKAIDYKNNLDDYKRYTRAYDATSRHMRRHPEQYKEHVELSIKLI